MEATTTQGTAVAAKEKDDGPLPKPIGWYHPEKTWTDILMSWLIPWLLPLLSMVKFEPTKESIETIQGMRAFRRKFDQMMLKAVKPAMRKWSKTTGSDIVEVKVSIPHRPNILQQWGIVSTAEEKKLMASAVSPFPTDGISVRFFFPSSLLTDSSVLSDVDKSTGCIPLSQDQVDLVEVCKGDDTHVLLWFHGGALVVGSAYDDTVVNCLTKMMSMDKDKKTQFVVVSVDYKLSPDFVFPVAPMESFTVIDWLVNDVLPPPKKLHVSGASAGGYLAAVTAMEYIRKFGPERVGTVCAFCPFIDPAADSMSYYLNSPDGHNIVPARWLRWSWQCYFELPRPAKVDKEAESLDELLGQNSNRTAWNEAPWKNTVFERLVNPAVDLPTNVGSDVKILVMTNRADPLHDEGIALVEKLRQGKANVEHFDAGGSHFFGLVLEPKTYKAMMSSWRDAIIGSAS